MEQDEIAEAGVIRLCMTPPEYVDFKIRFLRQRIAEFGANGTVACLEKILWYNGKG